MEKRICVLPGDGIGPEVTAEAVLLLEDIAGRYGHHFDIVYGSIGGAAVDAEGSPLPAETLERCKESDAVLLGAVGGPKWDSEPAHRRPEAGLLAIRKQLGVYANVRPVKVFPELAGASTLKPEVLSGIDLVIVRELTGGLYFGEPRGRLQGPQGVEVIDTLKYTEAEMERILVTAFDIARVRKGRVASVDKANVLESSRLWREVAVRVAADYPDVTLTHVLVDNAAMQLVKNPAQFDVIVTENLFGDILSDEAAMLTGSIGMLPSASLGADTGLYEPVHGSAPDIAGKGLANPLATFLSVSLMLRHSFGLHEEADAVETAVAAVLHQGWRTADIAYGTPFISTAEMSEKVREHIRTEECNHAKDAV